MKRIIIVVSIIFIIYLIYNCYIKMNKENFQNNSYSTDEINSFISLSLQSNKNLNSTYVDNILEAFNDSQMEDLELRLSKFKDLLKDDTIFDKSILDDLYFDLRMNNKPEIMNKLIVSYKIISDFIKNKEINVTSTLKLELTNTNKTTLLNLMKEYSKNNKFN